jgi:Pyrimidine operon attenuation protein/uracil phosphoribosyltransferase
MTPNTLSVPKLLDALEKQLRETLLNRKLNDPLMIGIHSGGVWVAEQMHQRLGLSNPLGLLDISFLS